jgi:hypothetical protein
VNGGLIISHGLSIMPRKAPYPYDTMNTVKQIPIPKQHTHLPAKEEIHKETLKNRDPNRLTTETIESTALTLQGIDDIEGSDCLSLRGIVSRLPCGREKVRTLACSVYVTASRITPSRKVLRTPRVSS